MAFCNSCGANLDQGTRFCNKCGAAVVASTLPTPAAQTPPPAGTAAPAPVATTTSGGGSALKVILIVVGVIVCIGILGMVTLTLGVLHIAKKTHVRHEGDKVK